jgi:L-Lysine epsilon oxidase N-terminal/L-lysine epsilon oxidase C-terminal domain/Iron-containing redox enzyme
MSNFRIHPAIGVARVGNSAEYVISPETMAGSQWGSQLTGGLPILAGTESTPIQKNDLRDSQGALKRLAARFRIFAYPRVAEESWPRGDGSEVIIGTQLDGKVIKEIIWTVHVANKKANTFVLMEDGPQGIASFTEGRVPSIRNARIPDEGRDPNAPSFPASQRIPILNEPTRVRQLTIDPGPRTICGRSASRVSFDKATAASYYDAVKSEVVILERYPKSFPGDAFLDMDTPSGPIDTLGELLTDDSGRLLVLGGYGRAAGWKKNGLLRLNEDVNNDQWFDDTSDGPVSATLVFDDGSRATVQQAWVTTTDPSHAPQIPNVVSLWDDVYDCWVRELGLAPDLYDETKGGYQDTYKPSFEDQIAPIFRSSALQHWTANLSNRGISAHRQLTSITATDDSSTTALAGLVAIFRNPFQPDQTSTTLMPLHLGDANDAFLTLRKTQYFFLQRWNEGLGNFSPGSGPALGPGEQLDKATLGNCLGGRLGPGIDLTFVIRERAIFVQPWKTSGAGPFRIRAKSLLYGSVTFDQPLLTGGYVPRYVEADGLEPGDLSKFMAIPWHTDYNSCATHPPDPNPPGNRTVFWSWPAQRPVAVYALADVTQGLNPGSKIPIPMLGQQRWSIRGEGTDSAVAEDWGRYQNRYDMLQNWQRIGVVLQSAAIGTQNPPLPQDWYLEVESQLLDTGLTPVVPFPNFASETDLDHPSAIQLDPRELFFKLLNVNNHPEVLDDARSYVDFWLNQAEEFAKNPNKCPAEQLFFRYTQQDFEECLDRIYQELVDNAEQSDPSAPNQYIRTREDIITRIIQWAPFNLVDGAWLRNIGRTGPMDEVRALLYSICMDEMGDGDISMNHCNIYKDLCHSVGYYPPPIESYEFAFDSQFLDSAFLIPAFQLAISQFTEDYYPEIIGMTLQLEWEVVELKPTRDLLEYFRVNPHFYVMHIGIDNAVNGHGRRAADSISVYLENLRLLGGEEAVQNAWRRIWNGFIAFGNLPFDLKRTFGEDLKDLITNRPSLRDQMIEMIRRKAPYGSRSHQQHMVGPIHIDEWFNDPSGFLDALQTYGWITPGDWAHSRMKALMQFETGPMFRVFTDDEIALWAAYTQSLNAPPSPPPPPAISPARAMAAVIDKLRPVQRGVPGHHSNMLADPERKIHSIAWWFEQPTRSLMEALASPVNDIVSPGNPEQSRFYTDLIAPGGPMGSIFSLKANPPNLGTCRDVVCLWISDGCPLLMEEAFALRLTTPPSKRDRHPTGRIYGMGGIH